MRTTESEGARADTRTDRWKRWVYFGILLVLALGTRLYQLDVLPYGHNNDETRMAIDGYLLLKDKVYEPLIFQSRESTFPYLYGLGIELFGFSNGIIRLPSALLGVIGTLCLCLLIFRILPDFWAFCVSLALVTYGPHFALDRLALRTSICTAAVFAFLLVFFALRSSERRLHWFLIGLVFGLGFHTYNAYRVMPAVVLALLIIHFWEQNERKHLIRKLVFFALGTLLGGANMVYIVLTESPKDYLWREADLLSMTARSEAGIPGMIAHNFVEFLRMLLGREMPMPVGAEVPYFHTLWLPFFAFGLWAAVRSRFRGPAFALLITFCVFLLPVVLTEELFARRFLTSLVLVVALTGIGLYEGMRWIGWERQRWLHVAMLLLAVGVASWNIRAYFVGYASMPKWNQGPFFASQRFFGPIVRQHVNSDTRLIFADEVEDPWTITIHLTGIIDRSFDAAMFHRLPQFVGRADVEQELAAFCSGELPVVFLYRIETSRKIFEEVMETCGTREFVTAEWPEGVVQHGGRRLILAKRQESPNARED